ncbi:hypothetical protein ACC848_43025, partial [Rhizobium johnstonii]
PVGGLETAVNQTRLLYSGANRMTAMRLATLNLPEGNAIRAPGEAPGLMALEIAIYEIAEKGRCGFSGSTWVSLMIRNCTGSI